MKLISIIIPAKNEVSNITRLYQELTDVAGSLSQYGFEFLMIDNASTDGTAEACKAICANETNWKYIKLSRNFGSEASLDVGLHHCTGDAAVVVFSDLQDPPRYIPDLVREWENGSDIVFGIYSGQSHEKAWKRILVKFYYKLLQKISEPPMIPFAGDFRLYNRKTIDVLKKLKERNRYMRGLAQWIGFKTAHVHYERMPRLAGKSKAPPLYLFQFAFSVFVNFSDKPLKLFVWFGFTVLFASVLFLIGIILNYFFNQTIPGLSSTNALILVNIAVTSLGFGVLGEYISKIYSEVKGRPKWIIEESLNIKTDNYDIGL